MAFNNTATRKTEESQERAELWMNVYVPIEGDSRRKVVGVPLVASKELHAAIIEQCSTDEGREAFINSLQFDFVSGKPAAFKLAC